MSGPLAKPQLRGFFKASQIYTLKKALGIGTVTSLIYAAYVKNFQDKVVEFRKNYDADAEFQRIKKLGYFQSVGPDD